jgi:hypothetical protein
MGEFHADRYLRQFGNPERQVIVQTERGQFRVDFVVHLKKDIPIKSFTIQDGILKSKSEVIRSGNKMGLEIKNGIKNGMYELRRNPAHIINQALAAKELTGNGCIGINQSMLETISKNPELYTDFFTEVEKHNLRVIVTQPTIGQQIANVKRLF